MQSSFSFEMGFFHHESIEKVVDERILGANEIWRCFTFDRKNAHSRRISIVILHVFCVSIEFLESVEPIWICSRLFASTAHDHNEDESLKCDTTILEGVDHRLFLLSVLVDLRLISKIIRHFLFQVRIFYLHHGVSFSFTLVT